MSRAFLAITAIGFLVGIASVSPALAAPSPSAKPSLACQRAAELDAAAKSLGDAIPSAVITVARAHCRHQLQAAAIFAVPTGRDVPAVKSNGPCRPDTAAAKPNSQLERAQALCIANWISLTRSVLNQPAGCVQRDGLELQGKTRQREYIAATSACKQAQREAILTGQNAVIFVVGLIIVLVLLGGFDFSTRKFPQ